MSEERAEKFLELFNKGKEFTEELLKENQRLRYRVASLESQSSGASAEEVSRLRSEVAQLTEEVQAKAASLGSGQDWNVVAILGQDKSTTG